MGTFMQVKQHDYGRPLVVDLTYRDPALDITTAISVATPVVFIMTLEGASTPTINRVAATVTAVDNVAYTATVTYLWRSAFGETAVAGRYRGEFEFALNGGPVTAPTGGYLTIEILPDLA